jgi:hypothetical protein
MLYCLDENCARDWNAADRSSGGFYRKPSWQTTRVRNKQLGNRLARRCKAIFNGFSRCGRFQCKQARHGKQAQDSLQDVGERGNVLLNARPAVGL